MVSPVTVALLTLVWKVIAPSACPVTAFMSVISSGTDSTIFIGVEDASIWCVAVNPDGIGVSCDIMPILLSSEARSMFAWNPPSFTRSFVMEMDGTENVVPEVLPEKFSE